MQNQLRNHSKFKNNPEDLHVYTPQQILLLYGSFNSLLKTKLKNSTRVSKSLDPDQARFLSGLIWFQTVCKFYQPTTLVGRVNLGNMACTYPQNQ